jgi:hypothetical protein
VVNLQQIGSHGGNPRFNGALGTFAQGDHDYDRANADNNA